MRLPVLFESRNDKNAVINIGSVLIMTPNWSRSSQVASLNVASLKVLVNDVIDLMYYEH